MEDIERVQVTYNTGEFVSANFLGGPFPNCSHLPHSNTSNETCTSGLIDLSLLDVSTSSPTVLSPEQASNLCKLCELFH